MASISHLNKLAATETANALRVLDELLPDDPGAREALYAAQNDVVGKSRPEYQVAAACGALARALAEIDRRLQALENQGS